MKLSIIIPVYNVQNYLRQCLESIYNIKIKDKEIIMVNDESPDESYKIIDEYQKKFPEITKVVNRKNGGLSAARNSGLEVAIGEYISFIDSDDFIDPEKFKEVFENGYKEKLDIISGRSKKIWDDTLKLENLEAHIYLDGVTSGKKYFIESLKNRKHRVEVWDDIYRAEFLTKNNLKFKEGILHEDSLFNIKSFLLADKVKTYDIFYYYYRQRSGSIMSTLNEKSLRSRKIIIEEILDFIVDNSIDEVYLNNYLIGHSLNTYKNINKEFLKELNKLKIKGLRSLLKKIVLNLRVKYWRNL